MRRACIFAVLSFALLAPAIAQAQADKAPPPACSGRDLFSELKTSDPAGYARIRAAADSVPNSRALLWRIERKGVPPSYLLGTIHSTDERVTLSPAAAAALNAATTVALEIVDDKPAPGAPTMEALVAAEGLYREGNGLKDVLTPAEMATLGKALAAEGIPENAVHLLRPWFATFAFAIPACEKRRAAAGMLPLDKRIERDARAAGKRVVGLETLALQIHALSGLGEDVQVSLLKATVATIGLRDDALEVMHRAWLRRDLAISIPFTRYMVERAGYDSGALNAIERDLAVKRNYGMREAALPLLRQGGAFIAVGGMHLVGKEGLVELFRGAGYTVTPAE